MLEYGVRNKNWYLYFPNFLDMMTGSSKASEFSTCERIFISQLKLQGTSFHTSPSSGHRKKTWSWASWPWLSWQTCNGPSSWTSSWTWKLVPYQLQLANKHSLARWEFRCHESSGHPVKKQEGMKYQFLNYPLLFLTPYSNKKYYHRHYVLYSYFGFKDLCSKKCLETNYCIKMLILKSGTPHWDGHISVKYWSIFKIKDISEIRILWASQKWPQLLS